MAATRKGFHPVFTITPAIAQGLMRIEAVRQALEDLPITPRLLASLRETAKLVSTHYSTLIEGNLLTQEQVGEVIAGDRHFPGRDRDQNEVRGYYAALDEVERLVMRQGPLGEKTVRTLHALVMGAGRKRARPTPYREEQNVIRDSHSNRIVYLPPEAAEVPALMSALIVWLDAAHELPTPLRAAIAHYQYATIHPYYDGNGRTARLLTTLILHLGGYGLKGLYALEEYYAQNLKSYYEALTVGPSHNYHLGRAEADITGWIGYFIAGMAESFERVHEQAKREARSGADDHSQMLRKLDARQRKALILFKKTREVTAKQIAGLFGFQQRTATNLCQQWVADGYLVLANPSKKARRYRLSDELESQIGFA